MPDYSKGKIYRIVCNATGLVYIGSTTQELTARLKCHEKKQQDKIYSSHIILANNSYTIELIENYSCSSFTELRVREKHYYDVYDCINMIRPFVDEETRQIENRNRANLYRIENPEKNKEQKKAEYCRNKEKYINRAKSYRENNSDRIKHIKELYRAKPEVREKRINYGRQYYIDNGKGKTKTCECGKNVSVFGMSRHKKTKNHIEKMSANNIDNGKNQTPTQDTQTTPL